MENAEKKQVCVITGGGSGMGLAAAKRMAKKGYYTILCGHHLRRRVRGERRRGIFKIRHRKREQALSCSLQFFMAVIEESLPSDLVRVGQDHEGSRIGLGNQIAEQDCLLL